MNYTIPLTINFINDNIIISQQKKGVNMKSENKPNIFYLPQQTIDKLNMMDEIRKGITGKGNNKSQIVREAIDELFLSTMQGKVETK